MPIRRVPGSLSSGIKVQAIRGEMESGLCICFVHIILAIFVKALSLPSVPNSLETSILLQLTESKFDGPTAPFVFIDILLVRLPSVESNITPR